MWQKYTCAFVGIPIKEMPVLRDAPVAVQTHSGIRTYLLEGPFLDIIPFEMLSTIWVHRQAMAVV